MELTFKKRNKNPKKRKINVYNGRELIASAIPYNGWYACTMPVDEDIRKEIRKIVIENLYWLLGCDCDLYEWEKTIEDWNIGRHIYGTISNVKSLFFSDEEKESYLITMAMFTMAVEIDDAEIALNCLTPQMTTLTTYNLVKNYWKTLGLNAEVSVYAEFDNIPS